MMFHFRIQKGLFDDEQKMDQHVVQGDWCKETNFKTVKPLQRLHSVNNPFLKKHLSQNDLRGEEKNHRINSET